MGVQYHPAQPVSLPPDPPIHIVNHLQKNSAVILESDIPILILTRKVEHPDCRQRHVRLFNRRQKLAKFSLLILDWTSPPADTELANEQRFSGSGALLPNQHQG